MIIMKMILLFFFLDLSFQHGSYLVKLHQAAIGSGRVGEAGLLNRAHITQLLEADMALGQSVVPSSATAVWLGEGDGDAPIAAAAAAVATGVDSHSSPPPVVAAATAAAVTSAIDDC